LGGDVSTGGGVKVGACCHGPAPGSANGPFTSYGTITSFDPPEGQATNPTSVNDEGATQG
jgi:hypothetical protein